MVTFQNILAESYIMYLCGYFVLLCTAVDAGSVHCCSTHFVSHLFLTVDCKINDDVEDDENRF